ncbi:aminoglycoside phosphotransferase family protein [Actinomyces trachealis]|uniref:aminoglycoside phosphotransferase family protein n=1 Tax=Actinomyces trachealis TaxID=2763540 RepID=UPI0018C61C80|nr:phosphotransferase [Actinomyces trachealis]
MSAPVADVLRTVLDTDALSELVGRPVRAVRLRVKPEVSLLMALAERDSGRTAGWARVLWPVSASKAAEVRLRAERYGQQVLTRTLPDGLILQAGPELADPKLADHLGRARERGLLAGIAPEAVLRYNPARRLVLRTADGVLRVRTGGGRRIDQIHRAVGMVLPVPRLTDLGGSWDPEHYSLQELCGSTDLEQSPSQEDTCRAGALLAQLHASTSSLPDDVRAGLRSAPVSAEALVRVHAQVLESLAPALARRTRALVAVLPTQLEGAPVLIHGDASPDQFLRDPASRSLWLTDFDRARLAPAAVDLGSYLAVCPPEAGTVLLQGYRQEAGRVPDRRPLRAATVLAELSRLTEPLRHADPAWGEAVSARLSRLEDTGGQRT